MKLLSSYIPSLCKIGAVNLTESFNFGWVQQQLQATILDKTFLFMSSFHLLIYFFFQLLRIIVDKMASGVLFDVS